MLIIEFLTDRKQMSENIIKTMTTQVILSIVVKVMMKLFKIKVQNIEIHSYIVCSKVPISQ